MDKIGGSLITGPTAAYELIKTIKDRDEGSGRSLTVSLKREREESSEVHRYSSQARGAMSYFSERAHIPFVPIPDRVTAHLSRKERVSHSGLFPGLAAAWMSVDDTLYMWNVDSAGMSGERRDIRAHEMDCDTIQSVAFARPKPGVFIRDVEFVIVLTGSVSIQLVAYVRTPEDEERGALGRMQATNYNITTEGDHVSGAVATRQGRIFMMSDDCTLYELDYANEQGSWPTFLGLAPPYKCRKLSHSMSSWMPSGLVASTHGGSGGVEAGVLSAVVSGLQRVGSMAATLVGIKATDGFAKLAVDDDVNVLYVVSKAGFIFVYDLGASGHGLLLCCRASVQRELEHWLKQSSKALNNKPTSMLSENDYKSVAHVATLAAEEGGDVHLLVLLHSGVRLYFSLRCESGTFCGGAKRPTSLKLVHVRGAPPPSVLHGNMSPTTPTTGDEVADEEESAEAIMTVPAGHAALCRTDTAWYGDRTLVSAVGSDGGPHQLVALVEDPPHSADDRKDQGDSHLRPEICQRLVRNHHELGTLQGCVSSIVACDRSDVPDCIVAAEAQVSGNPQHVPALGHDLLCMTDRGVYRLHRNSLTERLVNALLDGSASIESFAARYGHNETVVACLNIHCLESGAAAAARGRHSQVLTKINDFFTRTLRQSSTANAVDVGLGLVLSRRLQSVFNARMSYIEGPRVKKHLALVGSFEPITDVLVGNHHFVDASGLRTFEDRARALARSLVILLDSGLELPWEQVESFTFAEIVAVPDAHDSMRLLWVWCLLQGVGVGNTQLLTPSLRQELVETSGDTHFPFTVGDSLLVSALANFQLGQLADGMEHLLQAATSWTSSTFLRNKLRWQTTGEDGAKHVVHESVVMRVCDVVVAYAADEDSSAAIGARLVDMCLQMANVFPASSENQGLCIDALQRAMSSVTDSVAIEMVHRVLETSTAEVVHASVLAHLYRENMSEVLLAVDPEADLYDHVQQTVLAQGDVDLHRQYLQKHGLVSKAMQLALQETLHVEERIAYMECVADQSCGDDSFARRLRELYIQHKLYSRLGRGRVDAEEWLLLEKTVRTCADLKSLAEDCGEYGCMLLLIEPNLEGESENESDDALDAEVKNIWLQAICSCVPRSNELHKRYGQVSAQVARADTSARFEDADAWIPVLEQKICQIFSDLKELSCQRPLPLAFLVKELEWCANQGGATNRYAPHRWLIEQGVDYWDVLGSYMDYLETLQAQPSSIVTPLILKVTRILHDASRAGNELATPASLSHLERCVEKLSDYIAERTIQVTISGEDKQKLSEAETLVSELKVTLLGQ